jgi:outer membrane lipoprotein-sorting protein
MRYIGYGTATAAAVAVATAAGVLWLGGSPAAASFRQALDNANTAKSVRIVSRDPEGKVDMVVYIQGHQIRVEEPGADSPVRIWDVRARRELVLDPGAKTARFMAMTEDDLRSTSEEQSRIFNLLPTLRSAKDMSVKELSGEKVSGRPAKVFAFKSETSSGNLWVDAGSNLPARLKYSAKFLSSRLELALEFEDWNAEFDAKLFDQGVPDGYKLIESPAEDDPRTAFARFVLPAIHNAEKAKSVKVTATIENNGKVTYVRTIYRQGDLIRMETVKEVELADDPPVIVADLKTRKALLLHPKAKTARRITLGEQEVKLVTGVMDGLSGIKEQVAGGDEKAVKYSGEEKLGDRKTRAYEVTGKSPPAVWKVWVDPKTELPVRVRLASEKDKNTFTMDFDKWNEEFDPKLFTRDVPDGYKLIDGEKKD